MQKVYTTEIWNEAFDVYKNIEQHDFIQQLSDGSLSERAFAQYLSQDALYLIEDAKAFDLLSQKALEPEDKEFFKTISIDIISLEQALHEDFLPFFNVKPAKTKSPIIKKYSEFLLNHAENSPYPVGCAALLPCFWVYTELGKYMMSIKTKENKYDKWIVTYNSPEYTEFTNRFIKIVEKEASKANNEIFIEMKNAYKKATIFELHFFEESFNS